MIKVFIGSSGEQRKLVDWLTAFIRKEYRGRIEPIPWTVPWAGGLDILENLLDFVKRTDAAILFWTADDMTQYRNSERHEPRDNLVLEAGLFIAAHGRARTQLLVPIYPDDDARKNVAIPSDVAGMTRKPYDWQEGPIDATGLPNTARDVCDGLVALGPRPRSSDKLKNLIGCQGVEEVRTFVGDWETININGIVRLAEKPDARQIDLLAAYRVGEIRNVIGNFKKTPGARLRVCFANLFDDSLCDAYRRKYSNRTAEKLRSYLIESIELLFSCEIEVKGRKVIATHLADPPVADYDLRLTNQRITFAYYRINESSFVAPLDMKKEKEPSPLIWVVERETSPSAYESYLREYNTVFEEASHVQFRNKRGSLSKRPVLH
jgi:Predicted nucleotide-binding protein containing TIR-like domain